MNDIYIISIFLIGHFIADFLCQSREVATNKHHDITVLFLHVSCYIVVMAVFTALIPFDLFAGTKSYQWQLFFITNGVLHFITDFFTSKFNAWAWTNKKEKLFWNGIGFDQLLHTLTLVLTYGYIFVK